MVSDFDGMIAYDTWQGVHGNTQFPSEFAGDRAGYGVGMGMVYGMVTGDFVGARMRIQRLICE